MGPADGSGASALVGPSLAAPARRPPRELFPHVRCDGGQRRALGVVVLLFSCLLSRWSFISLPMLHSMERGWSKPAALSHGRPSSHPHPPPRTRRRTGTPYLTFDTLGVPRLQAQARRGPRGVASLGRVCCRGPQALGQRLPAGRLARPSGKEHRPQARLCPRPPRRQSGAAGHGPGRVGARGESIEQRRAYLLRSEDLKGRKAHFRGARVNTCFSASLLAVTDR